MHHLYSHPVSQNSACVHLQLQKKEQKCYLSIISNWPKFYRHILFQEILGHEETMGESMQIVRSLSHIDFEVTI